MEMAYRQGFQRRQKRLLNLVVPDVRREHVERQVQADKGICRGGAVVGDDAGAGGSADETLTSESKN
jgi:hypothetical protein